MDIGLCVDPTRQEMRTMSALPHKAGVEGLLRTLVLAMVAPVEGLRPARPTQIGIDDERLLEPLSRALEPLGIEVGLVNSKAFDQIFDEVFEGLEFEDAAYLNHPDVTPELVKPFFTAARPVSAGPVEPSLATSRWSESRAWMSLP